jgi:hypothetical protein
MSLLRVSSLKAPPDVSEGVNGHNQRRPPKVMACLPHRLRGHGGEKVGGQREGGTRDALVKGL